MLPRACELLAGAAADVDSEHPEHNSAQGVAGAGGADAINTLHVVIVKMVSETCSTK